MSFMLQDLMRKIGWLKEDSDRMKKDLYDNRVAINDNTRINDNQENKINSMLAEIRDLRLKLKDTVDKTDNLTDLTSLVQGLKDSVDKLNDKVAAFIPTISYRVYMLDNYSLKETRWKSGDMFNSKVGGVVKDNEKYAKYSIRVHLDNPSKAYTYEVKSDQPWIIGGKLLDDGTLVVLVFTNETAFERLGNIWIEATNEAGSKIISDKFVVHQNKADKKVDRTGQETITNDNIHPTSILTNNDIIFITTDQQDGDNTIVINDLPISDGTIHVVLQAKDENHTISQPHSIAPVWMDVPATFMKSADIVVKNYQITLENIDK